MSKETAEQFKKDRYILVKGFLDPFIAKTAMKYTLHKARFENTPEGTEGQIPHTHSVHGDHLMESLFETTWPKMEEITGEELWHRNIGGWVHAAPMGYAVNGKQYVAIAAGNAVFSFALPN